MEQTACANCGHAIDLTAERYCSQCGQRAPTHRIDWHYLWHQVQHGVVHLDGGILYTIKGLFTRPGHMIREYIQGKRAQHSKPLGLVVILAALASFVAHYVLDDAKLYGSFGDGLGAGFNDPTNARQAALQSFTSAAMEWTNSHYSLVMLMMLPIMAIGFRLAFRKYRATVNLPEWLVISSYVTAQSLVLFILGLFLSHQWRSLQDYAMIPMIALTIFSVAQYFRGYGVSWSNGILRGIGGSLIGFLLSGIVFTVILFIGGIVTAYKGVA